MSDELKSIVSNANYLTPSGKYISGRIVEYDIKSANISTLREANYITQEYYEELNRLPKQQREVAIGLAIKKDIGIYKIISSTIAKAREAFLIQNNIEQENVIRIANDAIYVNTAYDLANTQVGTYINFRPKGVFNVYLNLSNIIIFLGFMEDGNVNIDIKGIKDEVLPLHTAFISMIGRVITLVELSSVADGLEYLSEFIENYLKREVDIEYYREFNSRSEYTFDNILTHFDHQLYIDQVDNNMKNYVNIDYNLIILREFWSILLNLYELRS